MSATKDSADAPRDCIVVDARGLRCPLPVLRLARAVRANPSVALFDLLSDDPATAVEVAAWSDETGHRACTTGDGRFAVVRGVERQAPPVSAERGLRQPLENGDVG